jgi:hypothetical protein
LPNNDYEVFSGLQLRSNSEATQGQLGGANVGQLRGILGLRGNSGDTQGTLRGHSGDTQWTLRVHSGVTQGMVIKNATI